MTDQPRILIVEDAPADAELEARELRSNGLDFTFQVTDSRAGFLAALREFRPDLVLSDYRLPAFTALDVLALTYEVAPTTPVIVVTGSMDEETAVACMKAGAGDYVLKERLFRLPQAVGTVLERQRLLEERARAEGALEASERRYRALFTESGDGVFVADAATGLVVDANAAMLDMAGHPLERLRGMTTLELVAEAYRDLARRTWEATAKGGSLGAIEIELLRADGTLLPVEVRGGAMTDVNGATQLFGVVRDISERRRAEAERRRLAAALEQAGEIALITDTAGTIQYVNRAFERITGYTAAEAVGRTPRILKSGVHGGAEYRALWDTVSAGRVFTGTFVNRTKSGDHFTAELIISPLRDAAGTIVQFVCLERDVTREHELEDQLRQAQKMEAIGQLTGGIAHDFNNLLNVVLANEALARDALPPDAAEVRDYLADLKVAAHRGAGMVRKLLAFSRREAIAPVPVDLGQALRDIERTLRRVLPETIRIRLDVGESARYVSADEGSLEQMVLNLATNARDAMPEGGTLTLTLGEVRFREEDDRVVHGFDRPGQYVCVSVTDTGAGMTPETMARVFEPFFTTKPVGLGTGLGLPMVFGLMKQHGGFVHLDSEPGQGTTVRLCFPAIAAAAAQAAAEPAPQTSIAGNETILVVEDQESLRRAAARALTKLGYTVLVAGDGAEALRVVAEHGDRVQLVLSDLVMPNLGGPELYERLRAQGRRMPFLLMSGYAGSEESRPPAELPAIAKPWTIQDLGRKLRDLLDAPRPAS